MAPLIMSSINESWIPGRRSRRHSSWTYDDDNLPERWSEWCAAISTVLDGYLLSNDLELNDIVMVKHSNRAWSGPYTIVAYAHVDEMMSCLYRLNPAAHLDIATYGSSVQGTSSSSASASSTSTLNSVSAALIALVNGGSVYRELHDFAGAKRFANDFVKQAFGLRMEVCKVCSERWRQDAYL